MISFGGLLSSSICSFIYSDMKIKYGHRSFKYSHLKDEGHHEALIHAQPQLQSPNNATGTMC